MKNAFEELDFTKIKKLIKKCCYSDLGKRLTEQLHPITDKIEIDQKLLELNDVVEFHKQNYQFGIQDLEDTEHLFAKLKSAEIFTIEEFLLFARNIKISNALRGNGIINENFQHLFSVTKKISLTPKLEKKLSKIFDTRGNIKDNASENLAKVRKKQIKQKKKIYAKLNDILSEKQYKKIVQDNVITIRNERYVIPIKGDSESAIKGFVHSRSQTGSTVFLEPLSVFDTNNYLINLADEEKEEIKKILIELFSELQSQSEILFQNLKILQKIDFLNAAAKYCFSIDATIPKICEEPILKLTNARHPLLYLTMDKKNIVPFSLNLGEDFRALIISGVNTGGKTVTLKAVGLLSIMALSGLMIPVDKSEIGIFENFLTDINDEQSIENSISTFSSHIEKIRSILKKADEKSLILVDELGTGTDPDEGAALAQSIMEKLVSKKSKIMITTHLNKLKLFAAEHPFCENASMRFDQNKLIPTYQFDVGFPGNSYALDIAEEYKLSSEIVTRAHKLISKKTLQLNALLKKTEQQRVVLSQKIDEYKKAHFLVKQNLKSLQKREENWKKIGKENKLKVIQEGNNYLINLQQDFENELKLLKTKFKKEKKIETKNVENFRTKIRQEKKKLDSQKEELSEIKFIPEKNPQIGKMVLIKSLNLIGKVIKISKNQVKIKAGGILYSVDKNGVFKIPEVSKKQSEEIHKEPLLIHSEINRDFTLELNLIGLSFAEARPEIDKYIDKAILFNLDEVRIVHGKGTGKLREKIWEYFKRNKLISAYFSPQEAGGGSGVTIAQIR